MPSSESPLKKVQLQSLRSVVDIAYNAIKEAILDGHFHPGEQLVEQKLAAQLGISKTPVRDALGRLEREGLVVNIPFRGSYVRELSKEDAVEIFEFRQVLDAMLIRAAVEHLTDEDVAEIEHVLDEADAALAAGDRARAAELGSQYHHLIQGHARRERVVGIVRNLEDQVKLIRDVSERVVGRLEKSALEHRTVLEALKRRDPAGAEKAIRGHHSSFLSFLLSDGDARQTLRGGHASHEPDAKAR